MVEEKDESAKGSESTPLEVKVVNPTKEVEKDTTYEIHDEDEYINLDMTKEDIEEFENGD